MSETIYKARGTRGMREIRVVRDMHHMLHDAEKLAGIDRVFLAQMVEDEVTQAWLSAILDPYTNPWHLDVQVVEGYMPPYPAPATKPEIRVRWRDSFLRRGGGPFHPYFWDVYGDAFMSVQLAWLAVAQAPAPPRLTYQDPDKKK